MKTLSKFGLCVVLLGALAPAVHAEESAIREFVAAYVKAFNEHDLEVVTGMWTEDAAHTDRDTGERTEGRGEILADVAETFKTQPDARLAGSVDRVRMIQENVASVAGRTTFLSPETGASVADFTAILVHEGGRWMIDSIEESTVAQPTTARDALAELEWLVGRWVDEGEGLRVVTTVRWTPGGAFLLRSFVAQTEEGVAQQGTQIIGWDPRSREIRSWSFNADGSFGDGVWSKSGEQWLIKSTQTLAGGDAASGTYVLSRVDDDTITLKLIGHEVEGQPQPAREAVTVVRAAEEAKAGDGDAGETKTTAATATESSKQE
ncbi:MAG: nuclear transport factor 2 family protein [Pirellulaceae bacterium]